MTPYQMREFVRLAAEAEAIVESDTTWGIKYDIIFSEAYSRGPYFGFAPPTFEA